MLVPSSSAPQLAFSPERCTEYRNLGTKIVAESFRRGSSIFIACSLTLIVHVVERKSEGPEPSSLISASRDSISCENRGECAFVEDCRKNERKTGNQGCSARSADVALAYPRKRLIRSELPEVEGEEELLGARTEAPGACSAERDARDGCHLSARMNNPDNPEVLAVVPLPTAEERRPIPRSKGRTECSE
jgi:hypothetical protein